MVVLLLALSSIMAAMSYTSATVTSHMSGSVTSTDDSLLALVPGKHNAATIDKGILRIDFDQGYNNNRFGLQKQSEYTWDKLFSIKNNSENVVNGGISTEFDVAKGVTIYVKQGSGRWTEIDKNKSFTFNNLDNRTGRGSINSISIDVKVVVSENAQLERGFTPNLIVSGTEK